jgi:thiol-disulfide isomerase/thioredoxin
MENNPAQKISTPQAIIVAGALVMIGILLSRPHTSSLPAAPKTLSEQVGVSKDSLNQCIKATDLDARSKQITTSVDLAMSNIPQDQRGTPYSIIIGPNGFMTEILGADTYERTNAIIAAAMDGHIATETGPVTQKDGSIKTETQNLSEPYTGKVVLSEPTDHIMGSPNAKVTIIEYSDFECPFCKEFLPTLERIMQENPTTVRWIYRSYPLHQHSFEELVAADCVAKIGGDTAFWKYGDLLFGLQTQQDTVSDKL